MAVCQARRACIFLLGVINVPRKVGLWRITTGLIPVMAWRRLLLSLMAMMMIVKMRARNP
ncbi:hypothetical protein [Alicyclobacillus acidoterrestris]|uniref:hypothetical protein n=1 Tax=Alicyclobacillus acidoterrestris TaxID=1450 RepID=UPI001F34D510|nr:hypothetical protein [Alicyclobacillus acidoterrestris]